MRRDRLWWSARCALTAVNLTVPDAEFSRASIADRATGYADMKDAIQKAPWNRAAAGDSSTLVHRIERGEVRTLAAAA